eukprot:scaffold139280_cov22-Tisochrysis_lutea.AAC.1
MLAIHSVQGTRRPYFKETSISAGNTQQQLEEGYRDRAAQTLCWPGTSPEAQVESAVSGAHKCGCHRDGFKLVCWHSWRCNGIKSVEWPALCRAQLGAGARIKRKLPEDPLTQRRAHAHYTHVHLQSQPLMEAFLTVMAAGGLPRAQLLRACLKVCVFVCACVRACNACSDNDSVGCKQPSYTYSCCMDS